MRALLITREYRLLWPTVMLVLLTASLWVHHRRPFKELVAHHATSLSHLSAAQRRNVEVAAAQLDGWVVGPGERMSFNEVVGPRTRERGFVEANAFLERQRTRSIGGGVCLLASGVYAAVQQTPWPILRRVAHPVRVQAVPPGRDATVWYGRADLLVENSFKEPVKFRVVIAPTSCRVELWGKAHPGQQVGLRFAYEPGRRRGEQRVKVYRQWGSQISLLSNDLYRVR
ncbi:MAG: VanW family protein [Candidatus Sericytochromatia bacterium]|nr:VanW family protein [Candidatus Sericytochromatia bacterium]